MSSSEWPLTARQRAISEILQECLGPDPSVPSEAGQRYEVDAHLLDSMLNAHPSEEHVLDYFRGTRGHATQSLYALTERLLSLARLDP